MRTGVPCNESRFFPVAIGSQGVPCEPYRVWVCSACITYLTKLLTNSTAPSSLSVVSQFQLTLQSTSPKKEGWYCVSILLLSVLWLIWLSFQIWYSFSYMYLLSENLTFILFIIIAGPKDLAGLILHPVYGINNTWARVTVKPIIIGGLLKIE